VKNVYKVGVVGIAAALTLSACDGDQVKMGAAATFRNDRITESSLDNTVVNWQREWRDTTRQNGDAGATQLQRELSRFPTAPPRNAISELVSIRVWDQAARDAGFHVTSGEVQTFIPRLEQAAASNQQIQPFLPARGVLDTLTLASGLPIANAEDFAREHLIETAFQNRIISSLEASGQITQNSDPQTAENMIRGEMSSLYSRAAKQLKVEVNPRYGAFDPTVLGVGPITTNLSKPDPALNGAPQP
jgi:hypothetical protein